MKSFWFFTTWLKFTTKTKTKNRIVVTLNLQDENMLIKKKFIFNKVQYCLLQKNSACLRKSIITSNYNKKQIIGIRHLKISLSQRIIQERQIETVTHTNVHKVPNKCGLK